MPRPQYLSQDDKGWKLRRRVPAELQKLADKTQWVERLSGMTYTQACERARVFGVTTDAEIKELKAKTNNQRDAAPSNEHIQDPTLIQITDNEIDQIAIKYFSDLDKKAREGREYKGGDDDLIIDLAMDFERASAVRSNNELSNERYFDEDLQVACYTTALKQLIKHGFVTQDECVVTKIGRGRNEGKQVDVLTVPAELRKSRQFQRLADEIAEANFEMARRRLEAAQSGQHPTLQNPKYHQALTSPHQITGPTPEHRLGPFIKAFLSHKREVVQDSRYQQLLIAARALEEELGVNKPISQIAKQDCQAIADLFIVIPPYASRHYPNKTLRQAAKSHADKHGIPAQRHTEADKHLAVVREMFEYAIDQELLASNPAARVRIVKPKARFGEKKDEGYHPFTVDELKAIFNAPLYTGCIDDTRGINQPGPKQPRRSMFWVPLISLYSGLRMQEILQLEKSDIQEEGGAHFFSVTDVPTEESRNNPAYVKRLKRRNSLRRVPIHPELIKIGFLDYVNASTQEWLFPEMPRLGFDKMSLNFSRKFNRFLKPTGVWVPRKKVFHSFRATFNDALRRAEVPQELREPIMGWVDQSRMDNQYGTGHTIQRLYEQMSKVTYAGLDLSFLYVD